MYWVPYWVYTESNWILLTIARDHNYNLTSHLFFQIKKKRTSLKIKTMANFQLGWKRATMITQQSLHVHKA